MSKGRIFKIIRDNFAAIMLCIICAVLHFIYLDSAPAGWNVDETGSAIDAWYIAHFGTDRYGYSYPVLFYNYGGGGQSALFTYMAAAIVKIFGFSLYTVRFTSAFMSLLPLACGIVFLKMLNVDKKYVNLFALIYTAAPYFFMAGRFGLDCNLMLGTSSVFLICLAFAVKYDRKWLYFISGIAGGIVLYTYSLSYIVMIFFMLFFLIYLLYAKKLTVKKILCICFPLGLMASPLILEQLINLLHHDTVKIWKFTFVNLGGYRIGELGASSLKNFGSLLKATLFYDALPYNTNNRFLTLYWISIPFFFIGFISGCIDFVKAVRERSMNGGSIVMLWLISEIIMVTMLRTDVNANRINGIYLVVLLYVVYGIWNVAHRIKWEKAMLGIIAAGYIVMSVLFFTSYFKTEPKICRIYFGHTFENVIADIDSMEELQGLRVCVGGYYDYYGISRLLLNDMLEAKAEIESGRFQHGLPENPEYSMCYIVMDSDWEYCQKLYGLGLKIKEYENGIKLFYPG